MLRINKNNSKNIIYDFDYSAFAVKSSFSNTDRTDFRYVFTMYGDSTFETNKHILMNYINNTYESDIICKNGHVSFDVLRNELYFKHYVIRFFTERNTDIYKIMWKDNDILKSIVINICDNAEFIMIKHESRILKNNTLDEIIQIETELRATWSVISKNIVNNLLDIAEKLIDENF